MNFQCTCVLTKKISRAVTYSNKKKSSSNGPTFRKLLCWRAMCRWWTESNARLNRTKFSDGCKDKWIICPRRQVWKIARTCFGRNSQRTRNWLRKINWITRCVGLHWNFPTKGSFARTYSKRKLQSKTKYPSVQKFRGRRRWKNNRLVLCRSATNLKIRR